MHPEAVTLLAEDQLFKEHPDLVQLDAKLAQQAEAMHPGHGPGCECDHHHADEYIDRPEDHVQEPTEVHAEPHAHEDHHEERERGHDHNEHQGHPEGHHDHGEHGDHPPGCRCEAHGYKEVGQDNHIEGHKHNPDGSCCGKPSGEAKTDIDTHEHPHKTQTEAGREHAEAKHIDHEGHHHEAGGHAKDCHCANCSPTEAKQHIETGDCASGNCGHEHHSKVGATVDQEREHNHAHIHKEQTHAGHVHERPHHAAQESRPEEVSAHHTIHAAETDHTQHEAETVRQQAELQAEVAREQIDRSVETEQRIVQLIEPEPGLRPEVVEAVAHDEARRQIIETAEALASDTNDLAELTMELPANEALAPAKDESVATITPDGSNETAPVPVELATETYTLQEANIAEWLNDTPELYEVAIVGEELAEVHSELVLETEVAPKLEVSAVIETESATSEPIETPVFITNTGTFQEAQETAFFADTTEKLSQSVQDAIVAEASRPERPVIDNEEPVFAAIEEQFKALDEALGGRKPEVLDELHKSIANLYATLHDNAGEVNAARMSQEMLHLLTILGFEKPQETLSMYLQQYGLSVWEGLLARLFELLRQSRSMEAMTSSFSLFTIPTSDVQSTQSIGKAVLAILTKLQRTKTGRKGLSLAV